MIYNNESIEDIDKYKEMYILAKDLYYEEIDTFDHLEEKVSKHLYAFSIPLGALLIIARWITQQYTDSAGHFGIVILLFFFATLLSFAIGWVATFLALKLDKMSSIALNDKYIKTFKSYKASIIYRSLTINYKKAYNSIRAVNKSKTKKVQISYCFTIISFILLMLTTILIALYYLK